MKATATPELVALMRGPEPVLVIDLYEITLVGGDILRYGTADVPLPFDGQIYDNDILWERGQVSLKAGLEVDSFQVTAYAEPDDLVNGLPFHTFIRRGGFYCARMWYRRACYSYQTYYNFLTIEPVGVLTRFFGTISVPKTDGLKAEITVKNLLETLDRKMPRNLYEGGCGHTIYDFGCGVNMASFAVTGTVQAGSTQTVIQTDLSNPGNYFDLGLIHFESGPLTGEELTVRSQTADGQVRVIPPLLTAPGAGDTFTIWPGCDGLLATCTDKFANKPDFRGFPYIPVPETAR